MHTGRYRVRRGLFGKAILQAEYNTPSFSCGRVDVHVRDIFWADVDFDRAPAQLRAFNEKENTSDK